jgi:very-short-patch-repair endonuclease
VFDSPLRAAVWKALHGRAGEVDTQVGCAGYRIDLARARPRTPGRYLLGIECDGAFYHSAKTARDRDRLRQSVLEGLGWRIERVWSTEWRLDP